MKTKMLLISVILSTSVFAATDYKKCADFVNGSKAYTQFSGSMGFFGLDSKDFPFTLESNGKIKPSKDIVSYEQSADGKTETIKFKRKSMIGAGYYGDSKEKPSEQIATIVISRDQNGNLKEVAQAPMSKEDREKYFKANKTYLRYLKESFPNMPTDTYDQMFDGNTIRFTVKNGICLPEDSFASYIDRDGDIEKVIATNTEFCHDLDKLFKDHPELRSCFDEEMNSTVAKIFGKYETKYNKEKNVDFPNYPMGGGMYGGFGVGGGMGGYPGMVGGGMGTGMGSYWPRPKSLEKQLNPFNGYFNGGPFGNLVFQTKNHHINCEMSGLIPFTKDEKIWQEATPEKSEKAEAAETR